MSLMPAQMCRRRYKHVRSCLLDTLSG